MPGWLPGEFHEAWLARTATGARPTFGYNRGGFYIRKAQAQRADGKRLPKLTKNQRTMFAILQAAPNGLFANEWSEQAREAGLGLKRRADLTDLRSSLQARKLVVHSSDKWFVAAEYRNCPS